MALLPKLLHPPIAPPAMASASLLNHPHLLIRNPPSLHLLPRLPNPARRLSPRPDVKCSACGRQSPNSAKPRLNLAWGAPPTEKVASLLGMAVDLVLETLKSLQRPVLAAVLIGALLTYSPSSALAASGGRVGGRSGFSSHAPSSSRSYSASPRSGFSYSAPYFAPSPFGYGGGGGGGFYVGPVFGVGAGSGFFLLTMGVMALILLSGFLSDRSDDGSVLTATQKTSVIKLQVGLLGMARSFQKDLDRIAQTADTATPEGLHYVLTETVLALLRNPDCCISGYSSVDVKRSMEDGEKRFNQLSLEERGKFDEETLVNVNSIKKQSTSSRWLKGFNNEYIVITILVAAEGVHKLPAINSNADLKEALQKLGSIPANRTLAVEVLWTPQSENDTLSERELLEDYPLLRPL